MNNNQKWINQQELKSRILEMKKGIDRNLRDYLVLKLEHLDGIFVFASQVPEHRWIDLNRRKGIYFWNWWEWKGIFEFARFWFCLILS